jgi:hypothetical protein
MILVSVAAVAANEFGLPFGSPKEDPERALARSQSYAIRSAVFTGKA